jgi:hypothetical protein
MDTSGRVNASLIHQWASHKLDSETPISTWQHRTIRTATGRGESVQLQHSAVEGMTRIGNRDLTLENLRVKRGMTLVVFW